jgi:hypothetical protein
MSMWIILAILTAVGAVSLGFYWRSRRAMTPEEREREDAEMQQWQP